MTILSLIPVSIFVTKKLCLWNEIISDKIFHSRNILRIINTASLLSILLALNKMKLKTLKLTLWSLVIVLCATGFIVQVKYVSDRYMEYKTKTIVEMMIPTSLTMFPSVSACWSLSSLINESTIRIFQPNINMSNKNEIKIILSRIKINQIFDITPKENEIIENETESCMI